MNEQEVDRQINQMVQFIKQEAEEKANEIRVAAEEVRETRDRRGEGSCGTSRFLSFSFFSLRGAVVFV